MRLLSPGGVGLWLAGKQVNLDGKGDGNGCDGMRAAHVCMCVHHLLSMYVGFVTVFVRSLYYIP